MNTEQLKYLGTLKNFVRGDSSVTGYGKMKRLYHIMSRTEWRTIMIEMDGGIALGNIKGLADVREAVKKLPSWGATAMIMPKGMVGTTYSGVGEELGLIVNLSSRDLSQENEMLVGNVKEALRLGADAVCVNLRLGGQNESQTIQNVALTAESCDLWGVPLLVKIYLDSDKQNVAFIEKALRLGNDLGANMLAIDIIDDMESLKRILPTCPKPVAICLSAKTKSINQLLQTVRELTDTGAIGVIIGQSALEGKDPEAFLKAISEAVLKKWRAQSSRL